MNKENGVEVRGVHLSPDQRQGLAIVGAGVALIVLGVASDFLQDSPGGPHRIITMTLVTTGFLIVARGLADIRFPDDKDDKPEDNKELPT